VDKRVIIRGTGDVFAFRRGLQVSARRAQRNRRMTNQGPQIPLTQSPARPRRFPGCPGRAAQTRWPPRRTVRSRSVPSRLVPIPAESSCPAISTIGTGVARPSVHFPTSITSSIATPARNLSRSPFRMISEMLALRGDTCCKYASFPVQHMMGILRIGPPCAARPPAAEAQTATAPLSSNSHLFSTHHYQLTTASYNVAQGIPPRGCCPCFAKPATLAAQKPWRLNGSYGVSITRSAMPNTLRRSTNRFLPSDGCSSSSGGHIASSGNRRFRSTGSNQNP
jgi:hypothetical protein